AQGESSGAELIECVFRMRNLRNLGFVNPLSNEAPTEIRYSRDEAYFAFIKDRKVEFLGEGGTGIVVREISPVRRLAKIFSPNEDGAADFKKDKFLYGLLDKFQKQSKAKIHIPKVIGEDGTILFMEDIVGIDLDTLHYGDNYNDSLVVA